MKVLLSLLTIGLLGFSTANALSVVTIKAGSSVSVDAGESVEVRCEGRRGDRPERRELIKADCVYNGITRGEVIAYSGHANKCKNEVHSKSAPKNYISFGRVDNVRCDCTYNGITRGEVIGTDDHASQCKEIHRNSKPENCEAF